MFANSKIRFNECTFIILNGSLIFCSLLCPSAVFFVWLLVCTAVVFKQCNTVIMKTFLSHSNPCFQSNTAIFLVLHTCEIRFHDVIDRTVRMSSYANIPKHGQMSKFRFSLENIQIVQSFIVDRSHC